MDQLTNEQKQEILDQFGQKVVKHGKRQMAV